MRGACTCCSFQSPWLSGHASVPINQGMGEVGRWLDGTASIRWLGSGRLNESGHPPIVLGSALTARDVPTHSGSHACGAAPFDAPCPLYPRPAGVRLNGDPARDGRRDRHVDHLDHGALTLSPACHYLPRVGSIIQDVRTTTRASRRRSLTTLTSAPRALSAS